MTEGNLKFKHYGQMVFDLFKRMDTPLLSMMHATVGIAGEAGELLDAFKKVWAYNRKVDMDNVAEEMGDLAFYIQAAHIMRGSSYDGLHPAYHFYPMFSAHADENPIKLILAGNKLFTSAGKLLEFTTSGCESPQFNMPGPYICSSQFDQLLNETIQVFVNTLKVTGLSLDDVLYTNQWKLCAGPKARYPQGIYTDELAQARLDKQHEAETFAPLDATGTPAMRLDDDVINVPTFLRTQKD